MDQIAASTKRMISADAGLVSRRIFFDADIYHAELSAVFDKSWLFLGHDSQIPKNGDFVTTYMGEDPTIVIRDSAGKTRAFLNSCRHRGMKICRVDRGNTKTFQCPFHGWSYSNKGELVGVPYHKEAYAGRMDNENWGLKEVPKLANYGGFLFGNWDPDAVAFDTYLGDFKWYLDILLERPLGGIEFLPGTQKYTSNANWKIAAENFSGDTYHLPYSHGSLFRLDVRPFNPVGFQAAPHLYTVAFDRGHGLTAVAKDEERFRADLEIAKSMGPDVVDYVSESRRRLQERLSRDQARIYALAFGNIFPNFSFNNFSALRPLGFYLWHPKGPGRLEAWQWCAVDSAAPQSVKDIIRVDFSRVQSTTGIAAQDDTENFEQVTEATRGVVGQSLDFHYRMDIEDDRRVQIEGLPGQLSKYFSESGQRAFYKRWAELMKEHIS